MCDFMSRIDAIKEKIESCNHQGKEEILQKNIGLALRNVSVIDTFSFNRPGKINDGFNGQTTGIGLELGIKELPAKACNRYVDIASAKVSKEEEPTEIHWLCEVKVINPQEHPDRGRWYPYLYQYQCYPPEFDFLKRPRRKDNFSRFVTDADEGQIIFDFIKMMACRQKMKEWNNAEIYQALAIKNDAGHDFGYWRDKLVCLLKDWQKWCGAKAGESIEIYKWNGNQQVELQCKVEPLALVIDDLDAYHGYQHVLLRWLPAYTHTKDFVFQ